MVTHDQLWSAIDDLAARHGFTPSGLARAAGLDPTVFNPSKRRGPQGRPRWPSTESLAKILTVTQTAWADFLPRIVQQAGPPQYVATAPHRMTMDT